MYANGSNRKNPPLRSPHFCAEKKIAEEGFLWGYLPPCSLAAVPAFDSCTVLLAQSPNTVVAVGFPLICCEICSREGRGYASRIGTIEMFPWGLYLWGICFFLVLPRSLRGKIVPQELETM
jgi:hypothetical protein